MRMQASTSQQRVIGDLEQRIERRFPGACSRLTSNARTDQLSPHTRNKQHCLHETLQRGDIPKGRIIEFVAQAGKGATSFLARLLAQTTRRGTSIAYIDPMSRFHPPSAHLAGVTLQRVLWVRSTSLKKSFVAAETLLSHIPLVVLDWPDTPHISSAHPPNWRTPTHTVWIRLQRVCSRNRHTLVVLNHNGPQPLVQTANPLYLREFSHA